MKTNARVLIVALLCVAALDSALYAQFGNLKIPGVGSGSSATSKSPTAYVVIATVEFLVGGQSLMEASGEAAQAAKMAETAKALQEPGGVTKANLGRVDEAAAEMKKIADDKSKLDKADKGKITEAAIHVGVASYFEKLAVDAMKGGGLNQLANLGNAGDTAVLAVAAPTNLASILSVQTTLFSYLQAKGIDPSAAVQKRVAEMEKQ